MWLGCNKISPWLYSNITYGRAVPKYHFGQAVPNYHWGHAVPKQCFKPGCTQITPRARLYPNITGAMLYSIITLSQALPKYRVCHVGTDCTQISHGSRLLYPNIVWVQTVPRYHLGPGSTQSHLGPGCTQTYCLKYHPVPGYTQVSLGFRTVLKYYFG